MKLIHYRLALFGIIPTTVLAALFLYYVVVVDSYLSVWSRLALGIIGSGLLIHLLTSLWYVASWLRENKKSEGTT